MSKGSCKGCLCLGAKIAKVLVIIGGINWGLVGVGMLMSKDLNVVHMALVSMPTTEALVYLLVGLAALISIFGCKCKKCMGGACGGGTCASGSCEGETCKGKMEDKMGGEMM